jgi:hypothetical protein
VELTWDDRMKIFGLGEPLESLIERKNKVHGGVNLDTQAEREDFFSGLFSAGGRTLVGKGKEDLKNMIRLSPYMNRVAYGVRHGIIERWKDPETIDAMAQSEDMFNVWVKENRDVIKEGMLKGSESARYTVAVDKEIAKMRQQIKDYYVTEAVVDVMNNYIRAANAEGEKLPMAERTNNKVSRLPYGEQGFNHVIRKYKK